MVISEDGTDEEKEHLTVAPTKRHLLDSDEEEEGGKEGRRGRESDPTCIL